jgi:two-component system chemotaxis sensor kinase CheA
MGDGRVALILDTMALARRAGLTVDGVESTDDVRVHPVSERASLLVVALADGRRAAIPLGAVDRLEEFAAARIERAGSHEVVQYRGVILPLLRLDHALQGYGGPGEDAPLQVVVCRSAGRRVGVVVAGILDIVEDDLAVRTHLDSTGHQGSAVVDGHVTELVDIDAAVGSLGPRLLAPAGPVRG